MKTHPFSHFGPISFDMKSRQYFFLGMKNTYAKFGPDRRKMNDFASNPPLSPILTTGVGFSLRNQSSIFFREMKNTCAKFVPDLSWNAWFCIKTHPFLILAPGVGFQNETTPYKEYRPTHIYRVHLNNDIYIIYRFILDLLHTHLTVQLGPNCSIGTNIKWIEWNIVGLLGAGLPIGI